MAKKQSRENLPIQLPLPDFIEQLNNNPGISFRFEVTEDDIGGQLLSILSRGLYSDPLDFVREYVQNAVDGKASNVRLRITGRSVSIEDDGVGMTVEELLEARKVGFSPKSLWDNVGFRGIGIYSSFDVCNRLYIATKKSGTITENILEFNFEAMRAQLELSDQSSLEQGVNLTKLISENSSFRIEPLENEFLDHHYTRVYLDELDESHFRELVTKREKLKDYILRNVPIDFSDEFEHKQQINSLLKQHTEGYNPVVVYLEVEGQEPQEISRPAIPDLQEPTFGYIQNSRNVEIAFFWACLHEKGKAIDREYVDYRGFTYKIRGFSIGNNKKLKESFGRAGGGTLYDWYLGEIYVLDKNVKPNSARSDFEPSEAKNSLEIAVEGKLSELYRMASRLQKQLRSDKVIDDAEAEIDQVALNIDNLDTNELLDKFRSIANLAEKVEKQVSSSSDRPHAEKVLERADDLRKKIQRYIDRGKASPAIPLPVNTDQDADIQSLQDDHHKEDTETTNGHVPISVEEEEKIQGESNVLSTSFTPSEREEPYNDSNHKYTLMTLLGELGFEFDDEAAHIIRLIDIAISEILSYESDKYIAFLDEVEQLLNE